MPQNGVREKVFAGAPAKKLNIGALADHAIHRQVRMFISQHAD